MIVLSFYEIKFLYSVAFAGRKSILLHLRGKLLANFTAIYRLWARLNAVKLYITSLTFATYGTLSSE